MRAAPPWRVMVVGCGGSGKTTLAIEVARRTGLPLVHLDRLYWSSGWTPTPPEAWRDTMRAEVARERWVLDGNYGGTLDLRLERADTVVFLDVPTWTCLVRVVRRRFRYGGRSRPSLPEGCPERLTVEFLWWIATYRRRRRPGLLARFADLAPGVAVHLLRTPDEIERFLDGLGEGPGSGAS